MRPGYRRRRWLLSGGARIGLNSNSSVCQRFGHRPSRLTHDRHPCGTDPSSLPRRRFPREGYDCGGSLLDHRHVLAGNLIQLIYCRVNFTQPNRPFFGRYGDFQHLVIALACSREGGVILAPMGCAQGPTTRAPPREASVSTNLQNLYCRVGIASTGYTNETPCINALVTSCLCFIYSAFIIWIAI